MIDEYVPLSNNDFLPSEISKTSITNILKNAYELGELKRVFGEYIFENEVTILAGDTGIGKSILAYQISNSFAKGEISILNQINEMNTSNNVLYYDFELSTRSLAKRYKDFSKFSENLYIKFGYDIFQETDIFSYQYIENDIQNYKPKLIVIDNITALIRPNKDLQSADEIITLVKSLNKLKNTYNLNILILSHTVKSDSKSILNINQIQGSKNLSNLIDSAIMLGMSGEKRYIKHSKCRNGESHFQVLSLDLIKDENLYFDPAGFYNESELIKQYSDISVNNDLGSLAKKIFTGNNQLRHKDMVKLIMSYETNIKEPTAKNRITQMINSNLITKLDNNYYELTNNGNNDESYF